MRGDNAVSQTGATEYESLAVCNVSQAAVAAKASLWLVRQFEVSGDYANVRVNTG